MTTKIPDLERLARGELRLVAEDHNPTDQMLFPRGGFAVLALDRPPDYFDDLADIAASHRRADDDGQVPGLQPGMSTSSFVSPGAGNSKSAGRMPSSIRTCALPVNSTRLFSNHSREPFAPSFQVVCEWSGA